MSVQVNWGACQEEARQAYHLLVELHAAALALPVRLESAFDPREMRMEEAQWKRAYQRFGALPVGLYGVAVAPGTDLVAEQGVGDLADDLADIYRDVSEGLSLWDAGHLREALWTWVFSFETHWGQHLVDAQRVLHWWLFTRHSNSAPETFLRGPVSVPGESPQLPELRVGTWNVQYAAGKERNVLRRERLQRDPADIWVLTETHDDLDLSETHTAVSTPQRPTGRAGGRWTTIWSRWPVLEQIEVEDPIRTVAALIDAPMGRVAVYGTVLPWHSDPGPSGEPVKNWSEQDRVLPVQIAEWKAIRAKYPEASLVVAGDLNMNLGGKHYYGTRRGRLALREGMAELGLGCATEWDRIPEGLLQHSPIDHVLVPSSWMGRASVVDAWPGTDARGLKLSDHSGLLIRVLGE